MSTTPPSLSNEQIADEFDGPIPELADVTAVTATRLERGHTMFEGVVLDVFAPSDVDEDGDDSNGRRVIVTSNLAAPLLFLDENDDDYRPRPVFGQASENLVTAARMALTIDMMRLLAQERDLIRGFLLDGLEVASERAEYGTKEQFEQADQILHSIIRGEDHSDDEDPLSGLMSALGQSLAEAGSPADVKASLAEAGIDAQVIDLTSDDS